MSDDYDTATSVAIPDNPLWLTVTVTYNVRALQERARRAEQNRKALRP